VKEKIKLNNQRKISKNQKHHFQEAFEIDITHYG
jgi:hypothetical protein